MKNASNKPRQYSTHPSPVAETGSRSERDLEQRANRRRNRGASQPAAWDAADSTKLAAAIAAVTSHGYAVRFGYTKDGGAYAVGIIGDGEPFTEFVRPTEDINLYLDGLILDYGK